MTSPPWCSKAGEKNLQPYLIPTVSQESSFPQGGGHRSAAWREPPRTAPPFGCPFPETATGLGRTWHEAGCVAEQDAPSKEWRGGALLPSPQSAVSVVTPAAAVTGPAWEAGGARPRVEEAESQAEAVGLGCCRDNHPNDTLDNCHTLQFLCLPPNNNGTH